MRAKLALALALSLAAAPAAVFALGLGEIRLNSALNQPLDAEIELVSATPEELENLKIALASSEAFDRYDIERPFLLNSLRFKAISDGTGARIKVTSTEPIREPFLTFLVEANWASGRLLREYTLLLDPPIFADAGEPAAVEAPAMAAPARPAGEPPATTQTTETTVATVTTGTVLEMEPRAAVSSPPQTPPYTAPEGTYGRIQRGETLSQIAQTIRPEDVSLNQMMIALYRTNPDAFMDNINLLKQGSILRIPDPTEIRALSRNEANTIVSAHHEAWRQRRSGASFAAGEGGTTSRLSLVAPGEAEPAPAVGTGTAAAETSDERFLQLQQELSAARSALDASESENVDLSSRVVELETEIEEVRRLLALKDDQLLALQQQVDAAESEAAVEPPVSETAVDERQAAVEEPTIAETETTAPDTAAEPVTAGPDAGGEIADAADETTQPEETQAQPAVPATQPVEPRPRQASYLDIAHDIARGHLDNPMVLGGVAGVLVLLVAALMLARRRKTAQAAVPAMQGSDWVVEEEVEIEDDDVTVAAEPGLGEEAEMDETVAGRGGEDEASFQATTMISSGPMEQKAPHQDTIVGGAPVMLDENDPISEADFHMAYGLYDQAAEQIKKAIQNEPGRRDLKHKLVEIQFTASNKAGFLEAVHALRKDMGAAPDADWSKIVIMGKQLAPEDSLFQEESTGGEVDLEFGREEESAEASLDTGLSFELPEETSGAAVEEPESEKAAGAQDDNVLEFDLGDFDTGTETEAEAQEQGEEQDVGTDSQSDFDKALEELSTFGVDTGAGEDKASDSGAPLTAGGAEESAGAGDDLGSVTDSGEIGTKLDLARAYIDMGDPDGAKSILEEVLEDGNAAQKKEAQELISQLG